MVCNWLSLLQNGPSIMFYVCSDLTHKSDATSVEMAGQHLTVTPTKSGTPTFHNKFIPSICLYSCKQRSAQTCTVLRANTNIPPVRPASASEAWSWCSLCPGTYTDMCLDLTSGWCLQTQSLVLPVWVPKYSKFRNQAIHWYYMQVKVTKCSPHIKPSSQKQWYNMTYATFTFLTTASTAKHLHQYAANVCGTYVLTRIVIFMKMGE
jgi:hypothetical protein